MSMTRALSAHSPPALQLILTVTMMLKNHQCLQSQRQLQLRLLFRMITASASMTVVVMSCRAFVSSVVRGILIICICVKGARGREI